MAHSRARRSRIAHFKVPFIVGVAAPAAVGLACGGKAELPDQDQRNDDVTGPVVEEDRNDIAFNPPRVDPIPPSVPACPDSLPSAGTECAGTIDCDYGCQGGAQCRNERWDVYHVACNPPPPGKDCPQQMPEFGSDCELYATGLTCEYEYCYGQAPRALCNAEGVWEEIPVPSCNPPPPEIDCTLAVPVPGSDCIVEGTECRYDGCEGPGSNYARCVAGQWFVHYTGGPVCNPPPVVPVCPSERPAGSYCAYEGQVCRYGDCNLGAPPRELTCMSGIWQELEPVECRVDAGAP